MSNLELPMQPNDILIPGKIYRVGEMTLGCHHKVLNTEVANKHACTVAELQRVVAVMITQVCAERYGCKKCQQALRDQLTVEEKATLGYSEPEVGGPAGVDLHDAIQDIKDIAEQTVLTDEDYAAAERVSDQLKQ